MDVSTWINLLLWIHLVSLGLGGAAIFGIPVVGSRIPTSNTETRPLLFAIARRLSTFGRAAIGVLLITGPLMLWLKDGWTALNFWFWIKMALVAVLLATIILAGINTRRGEKGDAVAAKRGPRIGMVALVVYLATIFCAVFAFN